MREREDKILTPYPRKVENIRIQERETIFHSLGIVFAVLVTVHGDLKSQGCVRETNMRQDREGEKIKMPKIYPLFKKGKKLDTEPLSIETSRIKDWSNRKRKSR